VIGDGGVDIIVFGDEIHHGPDFGSEVGKGRRLLIPGRHSNGKLRLKSALKRPGDPDLQPSQFWIRPGSSR
jgi:hypothetical protein